jgi:hypothetical protein
MDRLVATLENHLTFRDKASGKILAIENQNGHLERYTCEPTNNTQSNELFGVGLAAGHN